MAFHIDTHDLPRIDNYKHARELFNRIPSVRGEDKSVKRLGNRKAKYKWLKLEIVDGIEVYKAGLHDTALITYYPTHLEMSLGGWYTISTCKYIERVGRFAIDNFRYSDYIPKGYDTDIGANGAVAYANGYLINAHDTYRFHYNREPMDLDKHPKPMKYKVNRKAIKAVRDTYQPFYQYVKTMFNLMAVDGKLEGDITKYVPLTDNILDLIKDESNWYKGFEFLASRAGSYEWRSGGHVKVVRKYYDMLDYVESAIRINNPQVLEVVN